MTNPNFSTATSPAPDPLFAGELYRVTTEVTISSGQNLARGAVVGRITATGEYVLSAAAAGDGSQTPVGILVQDTDATAADTKASIYRTGEFNEDEVILGAGHSIASIRDGLEAKQIYLKSTLPH
jgi:hypothetical protein